MTINRVPSQAYHPPQIEKENNLPPIQEEVVHADLPKKESEGYSTSAKVTMVAGSVIVVGALFWWCGGPGIAISAISAVSGSGTQQGNPPRVTISDIDAFSLRDIEKLREQFAINPPPIPSSPFSSMGVHISHAPSDIGSALQIGKEICDKIWTPANLANAENVITNWRPGEPINVAFYRPFIEYICQIDPVKKGTLLPKLEQIEQEVFRSSIPGQAQALAKGAIMGKVSQELQKGISDLYAHVFGRKDVPKTMEETDRRVLSALQDDQCQHVIDVQAFCELVESVFSRHPEEKVLIGGHFREAVKKIIQNNPEQREFLPAKYRNWVV